MVGRFYRGNTENMTRCNTGGELNKLLSSTSESCVCELRCTPEVWFRGQVNFC